MYSIIRKNVERWSGKISGDDREKKKKIWPRDFNS